MEFWRIKKFCGITPETSMFPSMYSVQQKLHNTTGVSKSQFTDLQLLKKQLEKRTWEKSRPINS